MRVPRLFPLESGDSSSYVDDLSFSDSEIYILNRRYQQASPDVRLIWSEIFLDLLVGMVGLEEPRPNRMDSFQLQLSG